MGLKEYILEVTRRERKARSKRLRELGGGSGSGSAGSTVVEVSGGGGQSGTGNGHSHANLATLDKLYADEADYLYVDQLRETEDESGDAVWATERRKAKGGWADDSGHSEESDHALQSDDSTRWSGARREEWMDQPVRREDPVSFGSVKTDVLRGASTFVDGLFGGGFQLWADANGVTHLTLDKLTVRQTMTVLELLIAKVRSIGGQLVVSAANGRVKHVEEREESYLIVFEDATTFVAGDLMRCATFTGSGMKSYWVEVDDVEGQDGVVVAKSEFDEWDCVPAGDDECVLMGNATNRLRQNLILISATEDGQPRIDVLDGVNRKSLAGCLRARMGNLGGIEDDRFPAGRQPHGNGLYSDNVYLKGTFVLSTGEELATKFAVTEGKIESAVSGLRQDMALDRGYLSNPSFDDGLSQWVTESETVFWLAGNRWIWANGGMLSKKGDGALVTKDMGRTVVRIKNKWIRQQEKNLYVIPAMATNEAGLKEAKPVYLSFYYRCARAGVLTVEFLNVDGTGFAAFSPLRVVEQLAVTEGYRQYTCNGLWNGTGDFKLSFTGDIYLYMLVLSTDKVEALTYRYRTLFEQSEKMVRIAAENFDAGGHILAGSEIITTSKYNALISERFNADGSLKNRSGLVTKAEGSGIYAQGPDGSLALIGVGVSDGNGGTVIKLTADNIRLEGLVTANNRFKILQDGSMEAYNGKFSGVLTADGGMMLSARHIDATNWQSVQSTTVLRASDTLVVVHTPSDSDLSIYLPYETDENIGALPGQHIVICNHPDSGHRVLVYNNEGRILPYAYSPGRADSENMMILESGGAAEFYFIVDNSLGRVWWCLQRN